MKSQFPGTPPQPPDKSIIPPSTKFGSYTKTIPNFGAVLTRGHRILESIPTSAMSYRSGHGRNTLQSPLTGKPPKF